MSQVLSLPLASDFGGKILVIRRDNIGDLVCTTPLLRRLREALPNAWIGALVTHYNAPVLAGNRDIDALFSYRKAKHREPGESAVGLLWARMRQMLGLRRMKIDIVLLPAGGVQASARQMARLIGAGCIVAQPEGQYPPMHETERAMRVLAPLGLGTAPPALRVCATPQGVAQARARLAAALPGDGPLIGLHVSARKPDQRWPAERFVALMAQLRREQEARFMLFWSPGDEANPLHPGDDAKAAAIIAGGQAPLLPWPTQDLRGLIDGLALCDSVICSDGGAMHLAAGLGKPIVCMFGTSDPVLWHPWGVPHRVLRAMNRRVADIGVAEAAAAWTSLRDGARVG